MKNIYLSSLFLLITHILWAQSEATNTLLLNFGGNTCSGTIPVLKAIENPFGSNPQIRLNCDLSWLNNNVYGISMSFNKIDQKLYFFNSSTNNLVSYELGLPGNLSCASSATVVKNLSSNPPSNFEFGPSGNIWTLSGLNSSTGAATIQSINPSTSAVAVNKKIQFPLNHLPTSLASGDISILPNKRCFAVFAAPNNNSFLYEITDYFEGSNTAIAKYIAKIPISIYGVAYINGKLLLAGKYNDYCLYYTYDINAQSFSTYNHYPHGSPIDNAKITGAIGAAKMLTDETFITTNSRKLAYRIFVKNTGDVALRVKIGENLQKAFPGATISEVKTSLVEGSASGITLNSNYNGATDTLLINNNFLLSNQSPNNLIMVDVSFTASNLDPAKTYYNNATAMGEFGSTASPVRVMDLSNDGDTLKLDPNGNGDAGEESENVATPWKIGAVTISGTIWNDADNSAQNTFNNIQTNTEEGTNGGELHAILIATNANKVINSVHIKKDGTFSFSDAPENTAVKVLLSTTAGTIDAAPPTPSIYEQWTNTTPLITETFTTALLNIAEKDFGIQRLPLASELTIDNATNPSGSQFYNVPTPHVYFMGKDPDYLGLIKTYTITELPTNTNSIKIDGTTYTASNWPSRGVILNANDAGDFISNIELDPIEGIVSSVITYTVTDNAGTTSLKPGTLTINFVGTLPVSILSFSASKEGKDVLLSWNTANETNMKEYIIEKSTDNKAWTILNTIASNTLQQNNTYTARDKEANGKTYYRLLTVDIHHTKEFIQTVSVDINNHKNFSIYPNPAVNNLTLRKNDTENYQMYLYDMNGRLIKHLKWQSSNILNIDISTLNRGIYILKLNDNNGQNIAVEKVIKR